MSSRRQAKAKKTVSFSDIPSQALESQKQSAVNSSQAVRFINGILIIPFHYLGIVWSFFKYFKITTDEVSALKRSIPLVLSLQIGYSYLIQFNIDEKKKEMNLLYIIASLAISLSSSAIIFIILVLFGAPFLSLSLQTFLLAIHLSLIVVYPLLITFKFVRSSNFKEYYETLVTQFTVKNEIYAISAGCIIGTWLGCFPIPLDWDRDWQTWPITLLVGGYLGGIVGGTVGVVAKLIL